MPFSKNDIIIALELVAVATAAAQSPVCPLTFVLPLIIVKRSFCWWRIWVTLFLLMGIYATYSAIFVQKMPSCLTLFYPLLYIVPFDEELVELTMVLIHLAIQWRLLEILLVWICRLPSLLLDLSVCFLATHNRPQSTTRPPVPTPSHPPGYTATVHQTTNDAKTWTPCSPDCNQLCTTHFVQSDRNSNDTRKVSVYTELRYRHSTPQHLASNKTTAMKAQEWFDKSTGNDAWHVFSRPNL